MVLTFTIKGAKKSMHCHPTFILRMLDAQVDFTLSKIDAHALDKICWALEKIFSLSFLAGMPTWIIVGLVSSTNRNSRKPWHQEQRIWEPLNPDNNWTTKPFVSYIEILHLLDIYAHINSVSHLEKVQTCIFSLWPACITLANRY